MDVAAGASPCLYSGGDVALVKQPKRILIVEDNAALLQVARFNIERAGFLVTPAANGRIAWELLCRETFDMVITDQQMPEMNGWELCQMMRESHRHGETHIVFLTAKQLEMDADRLQKELRVSRVLGKPYSPRELVEIVREILQTTAIA